MTSEGSAFCSESDGVVATLTEYDPRTRTVQVMMQGFPRKVYAFELETSLGTLNFTGISVEQYLTSKQSKQSKQQSSTATQSDNDGAVQMNLWDYIEVVIDSKNNMSIRNLRSKVRFAGAATYDKTRTISCAGRAATNAASGTFESATPCRCGGHEEEA